MNNDLISREAVIDRYYAEWEKQDILDASQDRNWLMQCLDEAPTVEVKDLVKCHLDEIEQVLKYKIVEVAHGRWIEHHNYFQGFYKNTDYKCSVCGLERDWLGGANYCPNCGARMDGE